MVLKQKILIMEPHIQTESVKLLQEEIPVGGGSVRAVLSTLTAITWWLMCTRTGRAVAVIAPIATMRCVMR